MNASHELHALLNDMWAVTNITTACISDGLDATNNQDQPKLNRIVLMEELGDLLARIDHVTKVLDLKPHMIHTRAETIRMQLHAEYTKPQP